MTDETLAAATAGWPPDDVQRVVRAYEVAEYLHRDQRRKSGEPYVTHPVEVAVIVARQGARPDTVCAALLHDVIDDTPYTIEQLRADFGCGVAGPVAALAGLTARDIAGADRDVLLLKLADRLHNMRTIRYVAPDKQRRKSADTLRILVPLAHRLGMVELGQELSALASQVLHGERGFSTSAVRTAAVLLPGAVRTRWLAEWSAELASLSTRRSRARFALGLILGMPRFAWVLRGSAKPHRYLGTIGKLVLPVVLGGTWASVTISPAMAWILAVAVIGCLTLATAVLFASSDKPAQRLRELIESWRASRPR